MRPSQARFVTACQQLLALGAVIAVLVPAASVVSLDVVITRPGTAADTPAQTRAATAPRAGDGQEALVETEIVDPEVTEVVMTPTPTAAVRRGAGSAGPRATSGQELRSDTEPVEGYGAVGVTWSPESRLAEDDVTVEVRTRTGDSWTHWMPLEYHDEHAPDPDSAEGRATRPGTDPLLIGKVDDVEARAVTTTGVEEPADMKLAVIDPGEGDHREVEDPALDTATLDNDSDSHSDQSTSGGGKVDVETSDGDLSLRAGSYTKKPQIFSRAQWGANERLRDKSSLRYHEVHAGFVHHTVNSNNYTRAEVPGIIRSIYAYHTQSRGWSDVGYNFLVDKFGRIWEGRAGGVDRPVVGAHTLGYNDYSFAMSAIGNFDIAKPPAAVLDAYGRLFAWKLSLHGVSASSSKQRVGSRTFRAINGHRDAGSTACPGRYLYAKLGVIRTKAAHYQNDWSGRDRATASDSSSYPAIVVRRASDKSAFVLPTGGLLGWRSATSFGGFGPRFDAVALTPDVTGDGRADALVRFARNGKFGIRPGGGNGAFATMGGTSKQLVGLDKITAVGDVSGNGTNDFVARDRRTGRLHLLDGNGRGAFTKRPLNTGWNRYNLIAAGGDLDGDGHKDLLGRDKAGVLWLHRGNGRGGLKVRVKLAGNWKRYDQIVGNADFTGDQSADLFVRVGATGDGFVLPGRGDKTFGHYLGRTTTTKGTTSLAAVDLTGSKDPDLIGVRNKMLATFGHNGRQNTRPMVNLGATSFQAADLILNVGDWDRDGYNDVVTRNKGNRNLVIHRGRAGGKYAAPRRLGTGWGNVNQIAAVGDMTGDGYPDLMGQPARGSMRIYPGNGKGFRASYVAHSPVSASVQLGLGLWNADGAPDTMYRVGNSMRWYAGNGPGGLTGSFGTLKGSLAAYDWVISPGDVDGDGRPDLVVRARAGGQLWVLPGNATGFGARKFLASGFGGYDLAG